MEIVPISKDSVVCLSKKLAHQLGGMSPIALVYRTTNSLNLIDVSSGQSNNNFIIYQKQLFIYIIIF